MCFPRTAFDSADEDLAPAYFSDGSLNTDNCCSVVVPEGVHRHIDNPFIEHEIEEGILGHMYTTGYETFVMYLSDGPEESIDPFEDDIDEEDLFIDTENESEMIVEEFIEQFPIDLLETKGSEEDQYFEDYYFDLDTEQLDEEVYGHCSDSDLSD